MRLLDWILGINEFEVLRHLLQISQKQRVIHRIAHRGDAASIFVGVMLTRSPSCNT